MPANYIIYDYSTDSLLIDENGNTLHFTTLTEAEEYASEISGSTEIFAIQF